jgi:hypothetical protein
VVVCAGVVALVLPDVVLDVAALAIAAPPPAMAAVAATVTSSGLILRIGFTSFRRPPQTVRPPRLTSVGDR